MKPVTHERQAPESYATFWEPVANDPAPPSTPSTDTEEATDAYLEFVNIAEGIPVQLPAERT
jgi:hypothetical protein